MVQHTLVLETNGENSFQDQPHGEFQRRNSLTYLPLLICDYAMKSVEQVIRAAMVKQSMAHLRRLYQPSGVQVSVRPTIPILSFNGKRRIQTILDLPLDSLRVVSR